jgi:glutaredoxin
MLKKVIFTAVLFVLFLSFGNVVQASDVVPISLFYGDGCPHCAKEKVYLNGLIQKYPEIKFAEYEVYHSASNSQLLQKVAKQLGTNSGGVPFLIVGDKHFIGFAEGITSREIENQVNFCINQGCSDPVSDLVSMAPSPTPTPSISEDAGQANSISVPIFGQLDISKLSLPILTIVLAFLDGFNPCAMWTLLFLISLLLGMQDKRRMWILGSTFIITSALVYFLFLSAWLNLFLFLGVVVWVRVVIALVALGAGIYYLRDYCCNQSGCSVVGDEKRQAIFTKLKQITLKKQFILALGGIILLAVAVNLVELVCSAGLPAIYTKILSLTDLPSWQYYLYLMLYILIFMLDDLFIFFTAMITLQAVGIESKYSRLSHLIGGVLMVIIGALLLIKPEWLMFG